MLNAKASELIGVVAVVDPDANSTGAITSTWIDASKFQQYMAIIQAGTLGTSATLDAAIFQATDASATGIKAVTGKAITQLVKATNDDNQAIINISPSDLDVDNGYRYFALVLSTGTATSDGGAVVVGLSPRSGVATANDVSTVVEVV